MSESIDQCPDSTDWERYLDDALSDSEFSSLDQHRQKCESCQRRLSGLVLREADGSSTRASGEEEIPSLHDIERRLFAAASHSVPEIHGYKIIRQVGQGGMGIVYEARQYEPLQRRVAVKVIGSPSPSRQMLVRFEREIKVLAGMSHPNVAKIFDSGRLQDGRQFFVMEFIDGLPLHSYCNSRSLNLQQRLDLFTQVCDGVQYSHSKLVVHRDLKSSNILVSELPGDSAIVPHPQVIDFGLAKAIIDPASPESNYTAPGTLLGTLSYMSPEQAGAINDDEFGVRSDVYSLGVILYKLLTGLFPVDLDGLNAEDALRAIREAEPRRPSECVSNADPELIRRFLHSIGMKQHELAYTLRNELDWVVMTAIEKDPERRYSSVEALMAELQRYNSNEQVHARPPSRVYRIQKFYRRNSLFCWFVVALLAGLFGTSCGLWLATENAKIADATADRERQAKNEAESLRQTEQQARQQAEAARLDAESRSASLSEALQIVGAALDSVNPKVTNTTRDSAVPNLLTTLGTKLNTAGLGNTDEVLQLRMKAADILVDMGELTSAIPLVNNIIQTCENKYGADAEQTDLARINLGRIFLRLNRLQEAQDIFWEIFQRVKSSHGQDHARCLEAAFCVAATQAAGGHHTEAVFLLEHVIKRYEPTGDPSDLLGAQARHQFGQLLMLQNEYTRSEESFRGAIEQYKSIAKFSDDHPTVMEVRSDLFLCLEKQGKQEEAITGRRELQSLVIGQYPANSEPVGRATLNLAVLLSNSGQHAEAIELLGEACKTQSDGDIAFRSRYELAAVLNKQGKTDEAISELRKLQLALKSAIGTHDGLSAMADDLLKKLSADAAPAK